MVCVKSQIYPPGWFRLTPAWNRMVFLFQAGVRRRITATVEREASKQLHLDNWQSSQTNINISMLMHIHVFVNNNFLDVFHFFITSVFMSDVCEDVLHTCVCVEITGCFSLFMNCFYRYVHVFNLLILQHFVTWF